MSKEKQIEEMTSIIFRSGLSFKYQAEQLYEAGYRKQSEILKEFVRRFESYMGNSTVTLGQFNDIQYALRMATKEMKGGE